MERFNPNSIEPTLNLVPNSGEEAESFQSFKLNPVEEFFTLDELGNISDSDAFDSRIQRQIDKTERMAGIVTKVKEEYYQKLPLQKDAKERRLEQCNKVTLFILLASTGTLDVTIDNNARLEAIYENSEFKPLYDEAYSTSKAMVGREYSHDQIDELYGLHSNHPVISGIRMLEGAVVMAEVKRTFLIMLDRYS